MRGVRLAALVLVAQFCAASAVSGQDQDRLRVHGYLTQGYAKSDSLPVLGIGADATADYRNAALQLRYALSDVDNLVLQVSHRRMGSSVLAPDGTVELDWAFYARRFGPASVKLGRFPTPMGIYSEIRDVGTLIPFYRPAESVYLEGFETLDGGMLSGGFVVGNWFLEASAYAGGADYRGQQVQPEGTFLMTERLERVFGGQLWVNTPIPGVRAGVGQLRFPIDIPGLGEQDGVATVGSVDVSLDRAMVRAEASRLGLGDYMESTAWYVQGGARAWRELWLNAQYELLDTEVETPFGRMEQ
jgi:hypothetical protein